MLKTFLFQAIQFSQTILIQTIWLSISIVFVHTELHVKTFQFKKNQFSIRTQFSSIWPIDKTLSGVTNPGQSGPRSDGSDGVLRIPQSSSLTGASPSEILVSYPGHSLRGLTPLQRCSRCILQLPLTEQYSELNVLFQIIQFSISIQFICQTVLFQAIQFCISTQFSSIWPKDKTFIRCYRSRPKWTLDRRQWRGTLHSPMLKHYWNLTIRLFCVI